MYLSFHARHNDVNAPRTVRHCWAVRDEQPYDPRRFSKPNRLGDKRRRQFMAYLRRRGVVTLNELRKRFGLHVAISTLATLWEMGLIDCLDGDRFAPRKKGGE